MELHVSRTRWWCSVTTSSAGCGWCLLLRWWWSSCRRCSIIRRIVGGIQTGHRTIPRMHTAADAVQVPVSQRACQERSIRGKIDGRGRHVATMHLLHALLTVPEVLMHWIWRSGRQRGRHNGTGPMRRMNVSMHLVLRGLMALMRLRLIVLSIAVGGLRASHTERRRSAVRNGAPTRIHFQRWWRGDRCPQVAIRCCSRRRRIDGLPLVLLWVHHDMRRRPVAFHTGLQCRCPPFVMRL